MYLAYQFGENLSSRSKHPQKCPKSPHLPYLTMKDEISNKISKLLRVFSLLLQISLLVPAALEAAAGQEICNKMQFFIVSCPFFPPFGNVIFSPWFYERVHAIFESENESNDHVFQSILSFYTVFLFGIRFFLNLPR